MPSSEEATAASRPATPIKISKGHGDKPQEAFQYPSRRKKWLIMVSLYITIFLIALVRLRRNPLHNFLPT